MDDESIRTRERPDGAIEAFEDGRWIEIAPKGTFRQQALDAGSAVVRAALEGTDDPEAAQGRVQALLRATGRRGDRAFALEYAERILTKLQAKGQAPSNRIDSARAVLASARRASRHE